MEGAPSPPRATPELQALAQLFYSGPEALGQFQEVPEDALPVVYRRLLAHDQHMTVTVESHHGCAVDVRVLETRTDGDYYARTSLLTRQRDQLVVQLGIVRLNMSFLSPEARAEIESQRTPLGRVLIQHNVLRTVRLLSLWRIEPQEVLCQLLQLSRPLTCYGRTALIYCNGVPAVELLEIVTPESGPPAATPPASTK